jgi:4-hydroxybenzoate polyprenyltransferase
LTQAATALIWKQSLNFFHLIFIGSFVWWTYLSDADPKVSPEDKINNSKRYYFYNRHEKSFKFLKIFLLILCLMLVIIDYQTAWTWNFLMGVIFIFAGAYFKPVSFLKFSKPKIKKIPYIKSFYVSLGWALGLATAYPVLTHQSELLWQLLSLKNLSVVLYFFALMLIDTLVLDLRDTKGDAAQGIKTLATLSPALTWNLIYSLSIGIFIITFFLKAFFFSGGVLTLIILLKLRELGHLKNYPFNFLMEVWRCGLATLLML